MSAFFDGKGKEVGQEGLALTQTDFIRSHAATLQRLVGQSSLTIDTQARIAASVRAKMGVDKLQSSVSAESTASPAA